MIVFRWVHPGEGLIVAFLLAVERTRLAHERTLIAWLRTALSMISFGFTIYKFFQFERSPRARRRRESCSLRGASR